MGYIALVGRFLFSLLFLASGEPTGRAVYLPAQ